MLYANAPFFRKRIKHITDANIIVETGLARDAHHFAVLIGFGASAVYPYLAYDVINELIAKGAQGIILGCTEIPILIKQEDVNVPVFDTTKIHATASVEFALK